MSIDKNLSDLLKLFSDEQLTYKRLYLWDYMEPLADRPHTMTLKIASFPSFFESLFNGNIDLITVSGQDYSLWHCLLYVLCPRYRTVDWINKKSMVKSLMKEVGTEDNAIEQIVNLFHINVVVVDNAKISCFGPCNDEKDRFIELTMLLYVDDSPKFHIVTMDGRMLFTTRNVNDSKGLNKLINVLPKTIIPKIKVMIKRKKPLC